MVTPLPPRRPLGARSRRSRSTFQTAGIVLAVLILIPALWALSAWIVMLLWGAIGTTFWDYGKWRTIGYGTAYLVTIGLSVLGSFFRNNSK